MRRRNSEPQPPTVEDLPPHLREFDSHAWGWPGPRYYEDGLIVAGYRDAWFRFLTARRAWCDAHPSPDWFDDVLLRHPDEPWGLW